MKNDDQLSLFNDKEEEWWEEHWQDMPEFSHKDQSPYTSILVHFEKREDMVKFSELIGQTILKTTQSIWYPRAEIRKMSNKRYVTDNYNES